MALLKGKRIALYGGSFDPVHNAHVEIAETVLGHGCVDQLIFLPSAHSPLKKNGPIASDAYRLKMLELATSKQPRFSVDSSAIALGGISYTVDCVRNFKARHPSNTLFWVLGADQFVQLDRWREIDSLARIINFIVIARPNFSLEKKPKVSVEFMHIEMPLSSESSSSIREDRRNGKSIIGRVPQSVQAFISQESLYK